MRVTPIPGSASPRGREGGFAIATVLMIFIITVVAGAYVLKITRSQASAAGGYYHARSAALAAQAGLAAAIGQLESDPAGSVARLNAYLADTNKRWLLGTPAAAGARQVVSLGGAQQSYAAQILAFDPENGLAKLEGQGHGPGGGVSKVQGVYRLGGLVPERPALARYAWFMAGESRFLDQRLDITGNVYFGGATHFNAGANGTILRGTAKFARGSGNPSEFLAGITFLGKAYFQMPYRAQGGAPVFSAPVGFESSLFLDIQPQWLAPGGTAYFNGGITGGNSVFPMGGNPVVHSGALNLARISGAGAVTNRGATIDIAAALGMLPGPEQELGVDLAGVPAAKRFTPAALGIAGHLSGPVLSAAYTSAESAGRLHRGFLFLDIGGANFAAVPGNVLRGKFVFDARSGVTVNSSLPVSDPASVALFHVGSGGQMLGFGGPGLFRGYVNVSGTGSVVYAWGAGCEIQGAVHHVAPTTGFQLNGSPSPLKVTFSEAVFEELAAAGVLVPPSGTPSPAPAAPRVQLIDARIRPLLRSWYF